jgi:hypothetical protein
MGVGERRGHSEQQRERHAWRFSSRYRAVTQPEPLVSPLPQLHCYLATFAFLDRLSASMHAEYLQVLVGSMQLLADDQPVDHGAAQEWRQAVHEAGFDAETWCEPDAGLEICRHYLRVLHDATNAPELLDVLTKISSELSGTSPDTFWRLWLACFNDANDGKVDAKLRLYR